MAVVIRMKRTGRKNRPCYRISVADSRSPRDGRTLETLGLYDPVAPSKEAQVRVDVDRARFWLTSGAQPSETVRSLFKRSGVYVDFGRPKVKRDRSGRKKATAKGTQRTKDQTIREERKVVRTTARKAARKVAAAAESSDE
ncbi:MAG: 30S ribosomal protein S16 [Planctomycetes bacterium]|nr:30S ribosomal protein S16 [Planctomycetota bacterium]